MFIKASEIDLVMESFNNAIHLCGCREQMTGQKFHLFSKIYFIITLSYLDSASKMLSDVVNICGPVAVQDSRSLDRELEPRYQ